MGLKLCHSCRRCDVDHCLAATSSKISFSLQILQSPSQHRFSKWQTTDKHPQIWSQVGNERLPLSLGAAVKNPMDPPKIDVFVQVDLEFILLPFEVVEGSSSKPFSPKSGVKFALIVQLEWRQLVVRVHFVLWRNNLERLPLSLSPTSAFFLSPTLLSRCPVCSCHAGGNKQVSKKERRN